MSKSENFKRKLLEASNNEDYDEALNEWKIVGNFIGDGCCICSQKIYNNYVVKNSINLNTLIIGSDCIKKFLGVETFEEYTDLQFLQLLIEKEEPILTIKNMPKPLLIKTVNSLLRFHIINEWEKDFLLSVCKKVNINYNKRLTRKQFPIFMRIKDSVNYKLSLMNFPETILS